jgi:hypothetical protein
VHNNGVGQNYYDCTALGFPGRPFTYSLALAKEAAAAAAPGGKPVIASCPGGKVLGLSTPSGYVYWGYTGSIAGYVHLDSAPFCPTTGDATTWN